MKRSVMLALAAVAALQTWGAKVVRVTARSADGREGSFTDVLARCEVKEGAEYDPAACARDVTALKETGEFEEIAVEAGHGATGVEVAYVVRRKQRFQAPLQVEGAEFWNASKIAKLSELVDGYAYGEADFAEAALRIRREYNKKNFPDAKVRPQIEPVPGSDGAVTVKMVVDEGARVKIRAYVFEGNESVDSDDLRASFGDYPWWNPLGWFSDKPVSAQELEEARAKIAAVYRDRGYLDAEVALPDRVPAGEGRVDMAFRIDEGPLYRVGAVSVTGLSQYPESAALAAARVKEGDVAGAAALSAAAHAVEIFCESGENPLAETRVETRSIPREGEPGVVDVEFAVTEGVPVVIDRILVRGNDYTKDNVIRREITLSPGDRMLGDRAEQSKRKLENLRYFDRVRYYLEKQPDAVAEPGAPEHRDLVYEVSEKSTGQFMIGIGASSVDSVYGTVELSESNFDLFSPWRFRGAGQKGRIGIQAGPRVQTYEAAVTEPYFLDRMLELTVEGYRRQRWYDDYDVIRNGAAVSLSYPMKFWPSQKKACGRFGVRLSAEYVQMDDVEGDQYYLPDSLGPHRKGDFGPVFRWEDDEYGDNWEIPLRVFWQDDTRDNFLVPTRGHRTTVFGDLVGGDNSYWKIGFNFRQYWTVWKRYGHVLSFGLRAETEDAFSDEIPIYDRLFLGGPRSIRGVEYREIAPRVYRGAGKHGSYAPWGGQTSWCMNLEYTIPVVKYVRLAAFTDLGSVGADEFDFDQDMFCWSAGVGIRLAIEQFPIRLGFATPVVDPDEDVDEQVFSFTVGYDF